MASTWTDRTITLWIDCKNQRVVYADAGKDVVDSFLSLLALSMSTVISHLGADKNSIGCVANLYESVQKLDDKYMCDDYAKDELLRPYPYRNPSSNLLQLTHHGSSSTSSFSSSDDGRIGFVKGLVNYMITDDLKVTPMSSQAVHTALKSCGVKDNSYLKAKPVTLGKHEGTQILKAAFDRKRVTVLTDVFLGKCNRNRWN